MATISKTGDNGNFKYELTVTQKNQSVVNNKSTVSITFKMLYNNYSTYWYSWGSYMKYTVTINGVKYTANIPDRPESNKTSNVTLIDAKTQDITHNSDGTKKINISFSVTDNTGTDYGCGNASNSGTLTLTTIPRTSSFKINGKESDVTVNVEDSVEIKITRSSSDFSHKIQCKAPNPLKNNSGTIEYSAGWITIKTLNKDTVKHNYTIHPVWYNLFISTTNPKLRFRVLTYSGSTKIGTSSEQEITLTLNSSKTTPTISKCEIDYKKDYCYGATSGEKYVLAPGTKTVWGKYSYTYPANYKKYRVYNNSGKSINLSDETKQSNLEHKGININSDAISFTYEDRLSVNRTYSKKNTEAVFYSKPSLKISDLSYEYEEVGTDGKYKIKNGQYTITGSAFGYKNNDQIIIKHALSTNKSATLTDKSDNYINIGDNGLNKNINKTYSFGELTLSSVSTPFYLLTSYQDGGEKSDEAKATKTYKIHPLFDWDDSNFQFNIPVYINNSLIMPKDSAYSLATKTGGSLNMNNGDIIKANRVVFADYANGDVSEGLIFPREDNSNKFDCLRVRNRNIRVLPNYDGGETIPEEDIYYPGHNGGDSVTFSNNSAQWAGHITGSSKQIYFTIPFNRPIITSTSKISISGQVVIRTTQGYGFVKEQGTTNAEINLAGSGITTTVAYRSGSGISVLIKATNPFQTSSGGELSNNRPLTVETAGVTVTFSK